MTHDRDDETPGTHTPETLKAMRSRLIGQGVAVGMSLGVAFGALIGLLFFENVVFGVPIGIGLGIAIGAAVGSRRAAAVVRQQADRSPGEEPDDSERD